MTGFWNPFLEIIRSFLKAWRDALLSGLPVKAQQALRLVDLPSKIQVDDLSEVNQQILAVAPDKEIAFILAEKLVLRHRIFVPEAASQDAKSVVHLEAERIMPLSMDQLTLSFKIIGTANAGLIAIDVIAIRKSTLDLLQTSARKLNRNVREIFVDECESWSKIVVAVPAVQRRKYIRATLIVASIAFLFYILSTVPQLYQNRILSEIKSVDLEIRESRRKTEAIAGLRRQVRAMQSLSNAVQTEQKKARIVDLLVQLTKASPDDIALDVFRVDGTRVFVSGSAAAPENWVIDLEKNPAFENVVLSSVRGGDEALGRRFEIRFDAVWPGDQTSTKEPLS